MKELILVICGTLFSVYRFFMILSILSSWIPALYNSKFMTYVHMVVRPYFNWFRFIPPIGMIDFSPIVAFLVYGFIERYALRGIETLLRVAGL